MKPTMGGTVAKPSSKTIAAGAQAIIERAAKHHITNIHIEPGPRMVLVRYRSGGQLYVANKLPLSSATKLTRQLKQQAGLAISQTAAPQTGRFELRLGQRAFTIEVDTAPVINGEKITIGLHEVAKTAQSLEELGLWGQAQDDVKRALAQPRGLVIVAGRLVKNLNLTLAALIQMLNNSTLKIGFVNSEDLALPLSIKQVSAKPVIGLSIARQLEILSHDNFDVIGVSTINDPKAGEKIAELTGHHLVLAGILADDIGAALARLQHLKIDALAIKPPPLSIGQTFVRQLCNHCREAYEPSPVELKQLDIVFQIDKTIKQLYELEQAALADGLGQGLPLGSNQKSIKTLWRAKPHGCEHCDHTGYSKEVGLFEVCKPEINVQKAWLDQATASQLEQAAIKDGMVSLKVDGLIKALRGLIDLPTLFSAVIKTV